MVLSSMILTVSYYHFSVETMHIDGSRSPKTSEMASALANPPLHHARAIHGGVDLGLPARQPTFKLGNAEKSDHEGFRGIIGNLLNSSSQQRDVVKVTLKIQLSSSNQKITNKSSLVR